MSSGACLSTIYTFDWHAKGTDYRPARTMSFVCCTEKDFKSLRSLPGLVGRAEQLEVGVTAGDLEHKLAKWQYVLYADRMCNVCVDPFVPSALNAAKRFNCVGISWLLEHPTVIPADSKLYTGCLSKEAKAKFYTWKDDQESKLASERLTIAL